MTGSLDKLIKNPQTDRFRSEGERRIAETLNQYGIPYLYEAPINLYASGKMSRFLPDFYLPTHNVYVEYYGRVGNRDYDARTTAKTKAYSANGLHVIPLYPWDLVHEWPDSFMRTLNRYSQHGPYPTHAQPSSRPSYASRHPIRSFSPKPYGQIPRSRYR